MGEILIQERDKSMSVGTEWAGLRSYWRVQKTSKWRSGALKCNDRRSCRQQMLGMMRTSLNVY